VYDDILIPVAPENCANAQPFCTTALCIVSRGICFELAGDVGEVLDEDVPVKFHVGGLLFLWSFWDGYPIVVDADMSS